MCGHALSVNQHVNQHVNHLLLLLRQNMRLCLLILCAVHVSCAVMCSTFVRILNGRRCGHEGGTRRACKKHRQSTFTLLSATGEPLIITTHLPGLAHRLKVHTLFMGVWEEGWCS